MAWKSGEEKIIDLGFKEERCSLYFRISYIILYSPIFLAVMSSSRSDDVCAVKKIKFVRDSFGESDVHIVKLTFKGAMYICNHMGIFLV